METAEPWRSAEAVEMQPKSGELAENVPWGYQRKPGWRGAVCCREQVLEKPHGRELLEEHTARGKRSALWGKEVVSHHYPLVTELYTVSADGTGL